MVRTTTRTPRRDPVNHEVGGVRGPGDGVGVASVSADIGSGGTRHRGEVVEGSRGRRSVRRISVLIDEGRRGHPGRVVGVEVGGPAVGRRGMSQPGVNIQGDTQGI